MALWFPFHTFWHLFTITLQGGCFFFYKTHNSELWWILLKPGLYKLPCFKFVSINVFNEKIFLDF